MKNCKVDIYRTYSEIQKKYSYSGIYYIKCTSFKHCILDLIKSNSDIYKYFEEKAKHEFDILQAEFPILTSGNKYLLEGDVLKRKFGRTMLRVNKVYGEHQVWEKNYGKNMEHLFSIDIPEDRLLESMEMYIPDDRISGIDGTRLVSDMCLYRYMRCLWVKKYGIIQEFMEY